MVSVTAVACPHCGHALRPVVVEQTSKVWKIVQLCGAPFLVPGLVMLIMGVFGIATARSGPTLFIVGLVFAIVGVVVISVGMIGAWWQHG